MRIESILLFCSDITYSGADGPGDCSSPDVSFGIGTQLSSTWPWPNGPAPSTFSHGQFVGCACELVVGQYAGSTPARVLVYVRDAVTSVSATPSYTPSPSSSRSAGASQTGTATATLSASNTPSYSATASHTPSAPPTPTPNRASDDWTCSVGGSTAYYTQLDSVTSGSAYAYTFFLPHKPANWPTTISADVLGCPVNAGVRSESSFGSTKFFMLPLGYPSEGAKIYLNMSRSSMAYALFFGRGCPASPVDFQCVAWTRLPCFTQQCVQQYAVTYTFTAADASTSRWYLALTNTDHAVGSGGFAWRTEGKFLPEASLAYQPPASPTPLPSDPLQLPVTDLGGLLYPFGPGAGDASFGRSDDGAARL